MSKVKMRENKNEKEFCSLCNVSWKNTRVMYDIKMNDEIFHLCYKCSDELFHKLLKANCAYNERIKTKEDVTRINRENRLSENFENGLSISEALKGIKDENNN